MLESLVSVVIAIKDIDQFTIPAIRSILDQSYKNIEVIIIFNGPNSNSNKIELTKQLDDNRLQIHSIPIPGLTNALNFAISIAKGDFVARMDSDDICSKDRILLQSNFLKKNPNVGVVGCKVKLIDEFDNVLPDNFFYFENDKEIKNILPIYNPLCHPAVMFRMNCLLDVGSYKYGFMSEDHELFIRIAFFSKWKLHNLNDVLFYYRRHQNQITTKNRNNKNFKEISIFLFLHFMNTYNIKFLIGILYIFPPIIWIKKRIRIFLRNNHQPQKARF
jgi:glycosyltransferase involved in cell wall biosynthesis